MLAGALADGSVTRGQVDAVVAIAEGPVFESFAAAEAELVPLLAGLSLPQTVVAMRHWRRRAEALLDEPLPAEPERSVSLSRHFGGRWRLDGDLDPESGEVVAAALRLADDGDLRRHPKTRRAEALVEVCRQFLDFQSSRRGGRHRPHLNVVVTLEDLVAGRGGHSVDGTPLDGASIAMLACDAAVHRVVVDSRSAVIDYGSATRTVTAPLFNAIAVRDGGCRFPDCGRPPQWCDGHHVVPFESQGVTSPANVVLCCRRHHRLLHVGGWHGELKADGTFVVTDPKGRTRTSRPPGVERAA